MRDFLRVISVVLCIGWIRNFELDEVSAGVSICAGKKAVSEPVHRFCNESRGTMVFRCCRATDNKTFSAIDLMDANLTEIFTFRNDSNLNLSVIDLRNNPQLKSSIHDNAFLTLKYLNELLLPPQVLCPGGPGSWEKINNTIDPPGHYCMNQISVCVNNTDLCTESGSTCVSNGPFSYVCNCTTDYHGYKCMRHGTFPFGAFFGATLGVTVVACVLLFWTQRRHVKKVA